VFESLKKAIDEIFGSVIRPIKEWILRQSWGVRVVCLIVIALAAFAWWKPQTVGGFYQQGTFYWRSWRSGSDKVPLSSPPSSRLRWRSSASRRASTRIWTRSATRRPR
jgi:hypothetical protein